MPKKMKNLNLFHLSGQKSKCGGIDVNMSGSVLDQKSSFKMLGLSFSSKLGDLILQVSSSEISFYPYKPTIWSCMWWS